MLGEVGVKNIENQKFQCLYDMSMSQLDRLQDMVQKEVSELNDLSKLTIEKTASDLDMLDYLFASIFGILGATISSSEQINNFLEAIHTDASCKNPKTLLGGVLNHQGDMIDQVGGKFINRQGETADLGFHRLLWGHDPLSLKKDNPFYLMTKQNGLILGILQVFRHLVADTFSRQGLPLPGHSFFDFRGRNGKVTNVFKELTVKGTNSGRSGAITEFNHLFTIRAQDIAAQGLVWAVAKAYFHARDIRDEVRQRQYKILSYSVNFFAHAAIGAIKQAGVPYINWVTLSALVKEIGALFISSYKEVKLLENKTAEIVKENKRIEKKVFETGKDLITYDSSEGYIDEIATEDRAAQRLINFFEG